MSTDLLGSRPTDSAGTPRRNLPVNIWAFIGAAIVLFEAWVLIRWVSGPFFERVPAGPSEPPTWMQFTLMAWQIGSIPVTLGLVWWYVVRPWRRDRHLGIDGILVIAFLTMWWQDPISSYGGHWFTYNTWMFNRGSWVNEIPGWLSYGEPGAMLSEPLLFTPFAYCYIFVPVMIFGSWFMKKLRQKWPSMSALSLILWTYLLMMAFDVLLEGVLWLPMGIFAYQGGHLNMFPERYHSFPLHEALTIGATFTIAAAVRFFVNDKGEAFFERGSEEMRGGALKKTAVRSFAAIAVIQIGFLLTYNVPNFWVGLHSREWNEDIQSRSYFTSGLCGEGTDRACPGPAVPHTRNDNDNPTGGGSVYIDPDGEAVTPPDTEVPAQIPFDRGDD